jgi:4-amino-4-deoxy-L-arabinose transferase-like glycosyltransferase
MAEPSLPPYSVAESARAGKWRRALAGLCSLALILQVALGLRIVAADLFDLYVHRGGSKEVCLLPDSRIYWGLARAIRTGAPYEYVEWSDIPQFALRAPGYPLFLAVCQMFFGRRTLAVRLVQAALGAVSVFLVYRLTKQVAFADGPGPSRETSRARICTAPIFAAAIAAVHPYYILMSGFILSEAVFVPLMLVALWGLALLWVEPGRPDGVTGVRGVMVALATGGAAGLAILVRPSWALYVPVILVLWVVSRLHERRTWIVAIRGALFVAVGLAAVMSPWWVRNISIFGRFVPTALWMGASLYDGLNPNATGASEMSFLFDREIWPLDEQDKDAELTRRAVAFARAEPKRALNLGLVKLGRYWSPWPNAEGIFSPAMVLAGAIVELPLFGLMLAGIWFHRRDLRTWALFAGPVLYFCAIHLVFASSMRYRIPGEMPALALAGVGWTRVKEWLTTSGS